MSQKPAVAEPPPLDPDECRRVWAWEAQMIRFYTFAMILISLAVLLLWAYGTEQWSRWLVIGGVIALCLAGAWVQFRERCPRCDALLGRQSRFMLPMRCNSCGVEFPRQPSRR